MNTNGIINQGNIEKIKKVMQRAAGGEDITCAFLGGSITQGSLASTDKTCYAYLVYSWWRDKFLKSNVKYVNAGIGGTTSQFGVSRVRQHVLEQKPDFLLTEFAVNDENDDFFKETYEGLVRVILKDASKPALLLMNNAWFDTGKSAEEVHLCIARHYDIPMVSMRKTVFAGIQSGELVKEDLSPDMLHPNDAGHELVAKVVIDFLERVYDETFKGKEAFESALDDSTGGGDVPGKKNMGAACDCAAIEEPLKIREPLTLNRYENSVRIKRYNMHEYEARLEGFVCDEHEKKDFLDIYSNGFTASAVGDRISFYANCTEIAVQYRKTINKPSPVAKLVIDGDEKNAVILDSNFEETWGDCLYIETAAKGLLNEHHKIDIEIVSATPEDKVPFYLNSVIVSGGNN